MVQALRDSKVELTWDRDDPRRADVLNKALKKVRDLVSLNNFQLPVRYSLRVRFIVSTSSSFWFWASRAYSLHHYCSLRSRRFLVCLQDGEVEDDDIAVYLASGDEAEDVSQVELHHKPLCASQFDCPFALESNLFP